MNLADPIDDVRARLRVDGIEIDTDTNRPRWDGKRPDYDHIVACLAATP